MKTAHRVMGNLCVLAVFICLVAGCAMVPKDRMASTTADFNVVVERAQNQMLLLNIVRASKRYPLYFTSFNALRGNMSYNFSTGGINIPFGSIGSGYNGAYSIAPNVSYSTNPNFDLTVLDTQEFTRGIMNAVPMCTLDYYWQQGWPKELLFHLFVERMESVDKDGVITETFDNYPQSSSAFKKFQDKIRKLSCKIESNDLGSGPKVQLRQESDIRQLLEIKKAGIELITGKEKDGVDWYQLKLAKTEYTMECQDEDQRTTVKLMANRSTERPAEAITRIYLRSPEAIIYYLGEIVRAETENGLIPTILICESHPPVPIFLVSKSSGSTDDNASVSVDFEGSTYSIRRDPHYCDSCRADRSMHVLSLISQLIGQQKKIETVPVTGVVNVIGR